MSLPETIPVRFTEEEAGYLSVRPVLRQTFRLAELADMIVRVSGKNSERLGQILRAGSVAYNGFRYWWEGFPTAPGELQKLLAAYPDDDPSRNFRFDDAAGVILESGGGAARQAIEIPRAQASARRLFRRRSPWQCLAESARELPPAYERYSYAHQADLFHRALSFEEGSRLLAALFAAAPRSLRALLRNASPPCALRFLCPRRPGTKTAA
ncbi:MAG: hypothetical protein LAN71_10215 [Acidobacteriia bacterium]|nr:hypothetical protein [Terriglobia bacterium]